MDSRNFAAKVDESPKMMGPKKTFKYTWIWIGNWEPLVPKAKENPQNKKEVPKNDGSQKQGLQKETKQIPNISPRKGFKDDDERQNNGTTPSVIHEGQRFLIEVDGTGPFRLVVWDNKQGSLCR